MTKELAFGQIVLDVYYMGSWVAWYLLCAAPFFSNSQQLLMCLFFAYLRFQLFVSLCLLPVTTLPGFGGIAWKDIPNQIKNGYFCFLGWNSQPGDSCEYNYLFTLLYVGVNFFYNIFILLVTKHASATLFTLAFALRLPLTQIVYTLHFIMWDYTEAFNWETIVSLVVVLVGFAIYSMFSDSGEEAEQEEREKEKLLVVDEDEEPEKPERSVIVPFRMAGMVPEKTISIKHEKKDLRFIRKSYFYRLGIKTQEEEAALQASEEQ